MTANWFIGATWMAGPAVVIMLRVRREEAMMLERFGDEYRHYMRGTGLLTPSLRVAYPGTPRRSNDPG
ncbi:MAG: hypothetical protein LLG45_01010 [Actinomycetia bacterium]|nr:hypothetical protein [Actinomycetes bacterium]